MPLAASTTVEIAFTTAPTATPTWVDVTDYVRSVDIVRGRSNELDVFAAGTASIVLDNRDRRFDPEHSTGPYYGNLKPMRRIRVRSVHNAITYDRFNGYIDGWPQAYHGPRDATTAITATDGLKVFALSELPSVYEQEVLADSPRLWGRLGEREGTVAADSSGNLRHGTYSNSPTFGQAGAVYGDDDTAVTFGPITLADTTIDAARVVFPESAGVSGTGDFTVECWIFGDGLPTTSTYTFLHQSTSETTSLAGSQWVLRRSSLTLAGGPPWTYDFNFAFDVNTGTGNPDQTAFYSWTSPSYDDVDDPPPSPWADRWNHLVGVRDGADIYLYLNGVLVASDNDPVVTVSAGFVSVPNGLLEPIDEIAVYDTALSAARVLAHYNAGTAPWEGDTPGARLSRLLDAIAWRSADRDIDTGSATLAPATLNADLLGHMQEVEVSEGGRMFMSRDGKLILTGRRNFWSETAYTTSQATFGDSGTELRYRMTDGELFELDDSKLINEARVRQQSGSEFVVTDAASQTDYWPRRHSENTLEADAARAKERAEWLVAHGKDPVARVPSITLTPQRDPTSLYPVVLGAELGYRYTVKRRPQGVGSAISKEVHLEGVKETITPSDFVARWELSPAEPSMFVWGVSTWGETTRWGY